MIIHQRKKPTKTNENSEIWSQTNAVSTLEITASGERTILEMALQNACFRKHGCVSVLPLLPIMKSVTVVTQ